MAEGDSGDQWVPADVNIELPSAARVYDYFLDGGHNFKVDRDFARRVIQTLPEAPMLARLNRKFLARATEYCVAAGIDQFLDVGCGLPTVGAVHEVAQRANPEARVLYADNEPVAVMHCEQLLRGNDKANVIQADLRWPASVLDNPVTVQTLDLSRPVALLIVSVMHFIPDADDPAAILARYAALLPAGSMLVFSHVSADSLGSLDDAATVYEGNQNSGHPRPKAAIERMLAGYDLVDPGLVFLPEWRPEAPVSAEEARRCSFYGAVGRVTGETPQR
ncbi:MAG: SAM-dependent methyltransferase [Sciscionella sp.]